MTDAINPDHYRWLPGGIEVIDITEGMSFCHGNVVKYVLRADHKGNALEDLRKAAWYLDREIARREAAEPIEAPLEAFTTPRVHYAAGFGSYEVDSEQFVRGVE